MRAESSASQSPTTRASAPWSISPRPGRELVATEALARDNLTSALAAHQGLAVWTAGDALVAALLRAAAIRDPARAAALLARLPVIRLLRSPIRRLVPTDRWQLPLRLARGPPRWSRTAQTPQTAGRGPSAAPHVRQGHQGHRREAEDASENGAQAPRRGARLSLAWRSPHALSARAKNCAEISEGGQGAR